MRPPTPEQQASAKRWTDCLDNMVKSGIWPEEGCFRRKREMKARVGEPAIHGQRCELVILDDVILYEGTDSSSTKVRIQLGPIANLSPGNAT